MSNALPYQRKVRGYLAESGLEKIASDVSRHARLQRFFTRHQGQTASQSLRHVVAGLSELVFTRLRGKVLDNETSCRNS